MLRAPCAHSSMTIPALTLGLALRSGFDLNGNISDQGSLKTNLRCLFLNHFNLNGVRSGINFKPVHDSIMKMVLGNHAINSENNDPVGMLFHQPIVRYLLESPRIVGMGIVHFLRGFLT